MLGKDEIITYVKEIINKSKEDNDYDNNRYFQSINHLLDLYNNLCTYSEQLENQHQKDIEEIKRVSNKYNNLIQDIKDLIEEIDNDKLNYSEEEWYLESEIKSYATDKIKGLLK